MTNHLPPRRGFSVRARLLSVTGLAVVASLLIWHNQVADLLDFDSAADKQPVVAGGPNGSPPPPVVPPSIPVKTPIRTPAGTPTKKPTLPRKTPTTEATISTRVDDKVKYSEESIEGLSPKLRARLQKAMKAAAADGVTIRINSGRRSAAKQARLFKEAIAKYGSVKAAMRWVLPPDKSQHVEGRAVDIAPQAAMVWLNTNGWKYGVCRTYDNEPWHFETRSAPGKKCPPRYSSSYAELG
ncbi:M15 family metallopeptidase [Kribbella sp. CA-293567]|uniref:M15 family metallopeptidase n=1 Tax=Kribbella sp. CA-293567 TaxID=3002436 RepID=UPI0022DD44A5|nr:M15 family metallopeptidase [Kribbella sp. CA-293567]WBQ04705.1 M15 family metallopeptidase [Kribbella sp. CA-293567]